MRFKDVMIYALMMSAAPIALANEPKTQANDTPLQTETDDQIPDQDQAGWVDKNHQNFQDWLQDSADDIDGWFGEKRSKQSARASLRVMVDTTWNEYDTTKIKPRVRGRIKLPTLEDRFSVVFGDDSLDYEAYDGALNDDRTVAPNTDERRFDRRQTRQSNSALALRWSNFRQSKNIDTDVDLGVRSNDVFIRARAEKKWQLDRDIEMRFEQMYRYGTHTEHTAVSTLEFTQPQSERRDLVSRSQLHYTHKGDENLYWHSSLFQRHFIPVKHGTAELNYGLYVGGDIEDKKAHLNTYGPYAGYRQPVWRPWLFLQSDVSYYNNKREDRDHYASVFGRVEVIF